jgi:hypothetical protein
MDQDKRRPVARWSRLPGGSKQDLYIVGGFDDDILGGTVPGDAGTGVLPGQSLTVPAG